MKKICFILFFLILSITYPCKFLITDYLKESDISSDNKKLELYDDYLEGTDLYDTNAIFKLDDTIYIRGEKYLVVDKKSYNYLGNGYYHNKNKIYYLDKEISSFKKEDKIKTYSETKTTNISNGTSCDGKYRDNVNYLEINNKIYINGEEKEENINIFSLLIKKFKELISNFPI